MPKLEESFLSLLDPILLRTKLSITSKQLEQLNHHYSLLTKWNQKFNLTSISESKEIIERHFGESLFLATKLPEVRTLVDVGSGAGFPGLPLAVMRPAIAVTLVESTAKKTVFLKEVTREISNVRVLCSRIEEVAETFDWAVCRAVATNEILPVMKNIASNIALMVSRTTTLDPKDQWSSVIPIPWSNQRVLIMGHFRTERST